LLFVFVESCKKFPRLSCLPSENLFSDFQSCQGCRQFNRIEQCFSTFLSSRHTLHQKKCGGTPKTSKTLQITSKNSCLTLNKPKLAMCIQSICANYHPQILNIGSKISKSNREKFVGTLSRSSQHTG